MSDENTYFGFFCLQVDGPLTGVGGGGGAYKQQFTLNHCPKTRLSWTLHQYTWYFSAVHLKDVKFGNNKSNPVL